MIVLVVPALCLAALCLLQASADVTSEQSCDPVPSPETVRSLFFELPGMSRPVTHLCSD